MTEFTENQAKPRILVADDSKVVRMAATKILSDKFELVLAADGLEAWKALNEDSTIQVVLTDLGMPNMDGYQLIEKMRQAEKEGIRNIPVVVITSAAEEEAVKKKVFEIGATDFISKPFNSIEIIARLKAHASYRQDKANLQEQVNIDLLTGTLNRKGLDEKLDKDISFVNRHQQNIALVVFEIDNYKSIFEKVGDRGSEKIIQNISKILSSAIRREDSFGRYDVATFLTILPMAKTDGVVMLSKRLCEHIKTFKVNIAGETTHLALSVGIASAPKGCTSDAKGLMKAAQQALANAKSLGTGEVQLLKLESNQAEKTINTISIDDLLQAVVDNKKEPSKAELLAAVERLLPLVKLMTREQKKKLLS